MKVGEGLLNAVDGSIGDLVEPELNCTCFFDFFSLGPALLLLDDEELLSLRDAPIALFSFSNC